MSAGREIRYNGDFASADFDQVDELFRAAGLGDRDPERYREACRRSYACVLAWDGDRVVGMGRLLSDGYVASAVFDVAVHPDYQGRGVGRTIMGLLHQAAPRSTHLLFAVPGVEGFYRKMGYYDCKTGMIRPSDPEKAARAGYIELGE
jgi:predicted N-acetyltransferase YhbS